MSWKAVVFAVAMVASVVAPVAATGTGGVTQDETISGSHVEFGVSGTAVVDYTVDGDRLIEELAVQSEEQLEAEGALSETGEFTGAGLSAPETFDTDGSAQLRTGRRARIVARDVDRGVLSVLALDTAQRVRFEPVDGASVRSVSGGGAVIEGTDGATASIFVSIGEGSVEVVNDTVVARLNPESGLLFRQYENGRSADDRRQEALIANGTIGAELYVESEGDRLDTQTVVYSTEVVTNPVTAERIDGTVESVAPGRTGNTVLLSVPTDAVADVQNATVAVDGAAATEASSYAAVPGSRSYLIRASESEPGLTDVLIGVGEPSSFFSMQIPSEGSTERYDGANVAFRTADGAIRDYTVNGRTLVSDLRVQSASEARAGVGLGASGELGADTLFTGAGLSVAGRTSTNAIVLSESGAEIENHDNDRGIVVVRPRGEEHVARFGGSEGVTAERESEQRAVVRRNGSSAAVIVVGDGSVSVGDGNVTARTAGDGRVVYRQYDGERSDSEREQERLIANGTATAEMYLQAARDAGEDGAERSVDVVRYGANTTVDVTERAADRLNATVDRTQRRGKVVVFSLQEAAFESARNATVTVDGEAAVEADSYAGVRRATEDGDRPAFLVRQSSSAEASVDVVVGIDHFSARQVSIRPSQDDSGGSESTPTPTPAGDTPTPTPTDGTDDDTAAGDGDDGGDGADGADGADGDGADTETGGQSGFGAAIAALALALAALLARRG